MALSLFGSEVKHCGPSTGISQFAQRCGGDGAMCLAPSFPGKPWYLCRRLLVAHDYQNRQENELLGCHRQAMAVTSRRWRLR